MKDKIDLRRVDMPRLPSAINAADYIVSHHNAEGYYVTNESWGPEGEIYRAVCVWVLIDIYNITGKDKYIVTARTILKRFKNRQRDTGGWAICLGDNGLRFKITNKEKEDSNNQEDPVIAGAILKSIVDYSESIDDEFIEMGDKAYQYIVDIWDDDIGTVNENKDRELTSLRSNPDAYHFLILQGIDAWSKYGSKDTTDKFKMILSFVRKTYEDFTNDTMPLMIGYHIAILSKHSSSEYVKRVIRPQLEDYLEAGLFASKEIKGGYGHRDGLRGIVTDELHMRSAIGLAYAMKSHDFFCNSDYFTKTNWYQNVCKWIDSMKSKEGGFYEFQDSKDGTKYGKGSPGQYLPALWILGATLK
jgi:hypothetical protein